ncbi:MAG: cyclase family protein [Pseudomonadota bacterium]
MKAQLTLIVTLVLTSPLHAADGPGELNNWGRWGDDDQKGAANYITAKQIVKAARLIKSGEMFSLAIPIAADGPVHPSRISPQHIMTGTGTDYVAGQPPAVGRMKFADDYIYMPLQGSTQWDGLSHAWYGDTLYNGVTEAAIRTAPANGGATKLGIENVATSLVGRGVLIDVLTHKGGKLPVGYEITRADIEATVKAQKTSVKEGDLVLLRTGVVPDYYRLTDPIERATFMVAPQAGIGLDVVDWIADHRIAGIAADNVALEVLPNPDPTKTLEVHGALLRDLGVYMGEIWWLEELAADCQDDGRFEFFLAAQPLNVPGAVGAPLNPIAIK